MSHERDVVSTVQVVSIAVFYVDRRVQLSLLPIRLRA